MLCNLLLGYQFRLSLNMFACVLNFFDVGVMIPFAAHDTNINVDQSAVNQQWGPLHKDRLMFHPIKQRDLSNCYLKHLLPVLGFQNLTHNLRINPVLVSWKVDHCKWKGLYGFAPFKDNSPFYANDILCFTALVDEVVTKVAGKSLPNDKPDILTYQRKSSDKGKGTAEGEFLLNAQVYSRIPSIHLY